MKIFLLGSHGTGKTTLCQAVKRIYNEYAIRDGVSRPVKRCRDRIGISAYDEQIIINELTFFYWHYNKDFKNLIMTRSPLDCIVYSRAMGWGDLADECMKRLEDEGILADMLYGKVKLYYIPIEFQLEDDGVRFTDVNFQKKVDEEFIKLIHELNLPVETLSGSVRDRVNQLSL